VSSQEPDHYATLGLDQDCSAEDIRAAYRWLAKRCHPDVNAGSSAADARTRALNAAYEVLSDAAHRQAYDQARKVEAATAHPVRKGGLKRNVSAEVQLSITELLRGTALNLQVSDSTRDRAGCAPASIAARRRFPRCPGAGAAGCPVSSTRQRPAL
jgi:curved DNA-binding protein CbpA